MINTIEEEEAGAQSIENMTISAGNSDLEITGNIEMKKEETICLLLPTLEIATRLIDLKIGIEGSNSMVIMTGETMLTDQMSIIEVNRFNVEDEDFRQF